MLLSIIITLSFFLFFYESSNHRNTVLQLYEIIRVVKSSRGSAFLAFNAIMFILFGEKFKQSPSEEKEIGEQVESYKDHDRRDDELITHHIYVYDSCDEDGDKRFQDDLEKKAQEFIETMYSFWREELVCDRFLKVHWSLMLRFDIVFLFVFLTNTNEKNKNKKVDN